MRLRKLLSSTKRIVLHPLCECRRLWFRLFHAHAEPHDIICRTKYFPLKLQSNSALAEPLFIGRGFEESEIELMRFLTKPGMQVIDVGANVGFYTILLGKFVGPTGHVWSFEPFPPAVNYIKQNVELNLLSNITIVEKAVAEKTGMLDFNVFPEGCDVYNSLGATNRPEEKLQAVRKISVAVTSIDDIADDIGIKKIDLIKIDVEGAEERVLRGAKNIIRFSPNVQIVVEIYEPSAEQCGCSSERLIEMLRSWGFSMYKIGIGGSLHRCSVEDFSGVYALFKRQ